MPTCSLTCLKLGVPAPGPRTPHTPFPHPLPVPPSSSQVSSAIGLLCTSLSGCSWIKAPSQAHS